jgi:hypothetical protein
MVPLLFIAEIFCELEQFDKDGLALKPISWQLANFNKDHTSCKTCNDLAIFTYTSIMSRGFECLLLDQFG